MSEKSIQKAIDKIDKMIEETDYDAYADNIGNLWARLDNLNKWLLDVKIELEAV